MNHKITVFIYKSRQQITILEQNNLPEFMTETFPLKKTQIIFRDVRLSGKKVKDP